MSIEDNFGKMTNRELILLLISDTQGMKDDLLRHEKLFSNHLSHHFRYSLMAWTAVAMMAVALIVALV